MKAHFSFLLLFLALCCAVGFAQPATQSITIGTHVLALGMSESTVLEQLGTEAAWVGTGAAGGGVLRARRMTTFSWM